MLTALPNSVASIVQQQLGDNSAGTGAQRLHHY